MKNLTLILHTLLISTLALTTTYLQSMESHVRYPLQNNDNRYLLTNLPGDVLMHIFSFCHSYDKDSSDLEKSIKYFIKTKTLCKKINDLLIPEAIGDLCKNHKQSSKDTELVLLMFSNLQSIPATILVYAGANPDQLCNAKCILENAMIHNDQQLITALLKRNVTFPCDGHQFQLARTIDLIQMFIDKGADIYKTNEQTGRNVLWSILGHKYSPDVLKFYLEHGVKANTIISYGFSGSSLLHELANKIYVKKDNIDEFLVKFKLLLGVIPHMVNTLNHNKQTPLDCVQDVLSNYHEARQELEASIRALGGLTAQELKGKKLMLCKK